MRRLECSRCRRIKPESEFNRDATRATGRQTKCRTCQRDINRRYRHECGVAERPLRDVEARRVHIHLPVDWIHQLDGIAAAADVSRAEILRNLIAAGLTHTEDSP